LTFTENRNGGTFTRRICALLLFVAILAVTVLCFSGGISGNDFWWHIKVGEWVVEHGRIPTTDIFSWYGTEAGIKWTAHEWLADVLFYMIYSLCGETGVFAFGLLAALVMTFLMYAETRDYVHRNYIVGGIFLLLFSVVTSAFFYGRPHVFGYFLLFAELKLLYGFYDDRKSKGIYFIPIITALWSNLHGGSSSLAYLLCIAFTLSALFDFSFGRLKAERFACSDVLKLCCVTLGSVAGILVNPIGTSVLIYPYVNLSDSLSMSFISEWQAPDAKSAGVLILFFLPIALITLGMLCCESRLRLIDLIIMCAFLMLFFRSARFIVLWYIAAVFYGFRYLPEIKVKEITKRGEKILVCATVVLVTVPLFWGISGIVKTHREGALVSTVMSDDAVEAVKKDSPERILNDYNLGEALIFNDVHVFVDSRADLYAENVLADYLSLTYLTPTGEGNTSEYVDVDGMIKKYGFDSVLILKSRALYSYIMNCPEKFELLYQDDQLGYFRIKEGN